MIQAALVDYQNEVVGNVQLLGRAHILPVHPKREAPLHTDGPHRMDIVGRVFELEGRIADGAEEWIYREKYWETCACSCNEER